MHCNRGTRWLLAALVGSAACGEVRTSTRTTPTSGLDPSLAAVLPLSDPGALQPVPPRPTGVVRRADGALARIDLDALLVRPRDARGLQAFLDAHPYLSLVDRLTYTSADATVTLPIPDRVLNANGSVTEEPIDRLVVIRWDRVEPAHFVGVDLASVSSLSLAFDSQRTQTFARMLAWMLAHDTDKLAGVQPVTLAAKLPGTVGADGGVSTPSAAPGTGTCPCVRNGVYQTPQRADDGALAVECSRGFQTSGYDLLVLRQATSSAAAGDGVTELQLGVVPSALLPLRIPGAFGLDDGAPRARAVEFGQLGPGLPPGARRARLPGPDIDASTESCGWRAVGRTLSYDRAGLWSWTQHQDAERVAILAWRDNTCTCWAAFCACSPDDLLGAALVGRGETAARASAHTFGSVRMTLETVAACRNGAEVCNGIDDDCDGSVDEDDPRRGAECAPPGQRVCRPGRWRCDAGHLICEGFTAPAPDVCDGADNDCNGTVDDGDPQVGDACGLLLGACVPGRQVCSNGSLACVGGTGPTPERCGNALDDDCDGSVDEEGCRCTDGSMRPCGLHLGVCTGGWQACRGGVWGVCEGAGTPSPESCNGLDDNCDGSVDEGCACDPGGLRACGSSRGVCLPGRQRCLPESRWAHCEGALGPTSEVCDGADNDCDGVADNTGDGTCVCADGAERACGSLVGACTSGTQRCTGGAWGECSGAAPTPEVCDMLDNNCNGTVDEGLMNACMACGPEPVEVCDGADNDCDGMVDEDSAGRPGGLQNRCHTCDPVEPAEVCDGMDNNCDGQVDEGLANCGVSVRALPFEQHGNGVYTVAIPKLMEASRCYVLVTEYNAAPDTGGGDKDYEWAAGCADRGDHFEARVVTGNEEDDEAYIAGLVVVVGFGSNSTSARLDGLDVSNGAPRTFGPVALPSGIPTLVFPDVLSMITNGDDNASYVLRTESTGAAVNAIGYVHGGNDGTSMNFAVDLWGLPPSVTARTATLTAHGGETARLRWPRPADGRAYVVLPTVRVYETADEEDLSFAADTREEGPDVVLDLSATNAGRGAYVQADFVMLTGIQ